MNKPESNACVNVRSEGATVWIALNRPEKRNAMNDTTLLQLNDAMRVAFLDDAVRTVVLTGVGECFSSGRDLKNLKHMKNVGADGPRSVRLEDRSLEATVDLLTEAIRLLLTAPKPTIAAVRGFAFGGGQALTLACDFVVAEANAQFANVEIAHGYPAAMNTALLARHLGRRMALEIALTGTPRSAVEYHRLGLVNRLCEAGALDSTTGEFAAMLNERAPWAVHRTKALMRAAEDAPLVTGIDLASQLNQLLRLNNALKQAESEPSETATR